MAKKSRKPQKPKERNLVAKHSRNMGGAGAHEEKNGKHASRERQKRVWKKDIDMIKEMNDSIRSLGEEDFIKDIENLFNISLSENNNSFSNQQKNDITKLISQYKERKEAPTEDEIGDDLEMLDYNPEEINNMIPYITQQLG